MSISTTSASKPTLAGELLARFKTHAFAIRTNWILWGLIALGIALRLHEYLLNRSFWLDELRLIEIILKRSYAELAQSLKFDQGAPLGFLWLTKLCVDTLGNSEYSFRLIPLLAGISSVVLFAFVASKFVDRKVVPLAMGFFVLSGYLIDYSAEFKQYSSDVLVALILYASMMPYLSKPMDLRGGLLLVLTGSLAVWFSHPAVFILAGIAMVFITVFVRSGQSAQVIKFSAISSVWAMSVAAHFFIAAPDFGNENFTASWGKNFMPLIPTSDKHFNWYRQTFFKVFREPASLNLTDLAAFCFVIGGIMLFIKKRKQASLLLLPVVLTLLASGFGFYPFVDRFLLFMVPMLYILIAEGMEQIRFNAAAPRGLIALPLAGLLFFHPVLAIPEYFQQAQAVEKTSSPVILGEKSRSKLIESHRIKPHADFPMRPVVQYLHHHYQPGDIIYVYHGASRAFRYYGRFAGFERKDFIEGVESKTDWRRYWRQLKALDGNPRVWIVFSEVYTARKANEESLMLHFLNSLGTPIQYYKRSGTSIYLYDLSKNPAIAFT